MNIKSITANETFAVRHPVVRPGRPIKTCEFELDNHLSSLHFGVEFNGKIIAVLSALQIGCENFPNLISMRLRGIATLPTFQKKGLGSQLIMEVEERLLKLKEIRLLWLNARINAKKFYQNLGYETVVKTFNVQSIGIHQLMCKKLLE
jgi:GNAT superfamily N-acetyltransferase